MFKDLGDEEGHSTIRPPHDEVTRCSTGQKQNYWHCPKNVKHSEKSKRGYPQTRIKELFKQIVSTSSEK